MGTRRYAAGASAGGDVGNDDVEKMVLAKQVLAINVVVVVAGRCGGGGSEEGGLYITVLYHEMLGALLTLGLVVVAGCRGSEGEEKP